MAGNTLSTGALRRSTILGGLIFAVFAALLIRILIIQTVNFDKYQNKVIQQITTESAVPADRGKIYDKNGNILATNITTYRVFISPSSIKSSQQEANESGNVRANYADTISRGLSEILGVSYDSVYKQATEYTKYLDRTIKRKVDEDTADLVREFIDENALEDMVYLEAQSTRYYPYKSLAAHVLGFTDSDGTGLYGIEYEYDNYLKGIDGYYIKARDSYGNEMPMEYASYIEAVDGYNVKTTLDVSIQSFLEEQLELTVTETEALNRACGIVMDVNTGAILAMATSSKFDLNDPWQLDEASQIKMTQIGVTGGTDEYDALRLKLLTTMWSNKAITESYIPGSTFKIITSSMALEENVVKLTESLNCSGSHVVLGQRIHCHKTTGHGTLTFAEGLQQSCNVWFMTLGQRLGVENYTKYAKAFGYYEKTGIDLPGEGNSIFASQMSELDLAIYAFGQNFTVTPIQHISAISAVANGGDLLTPYVVETITDNSGNVVYQHETAVKRQVVSEEVCKTIATILEEGVSGDGGAKNAYVAGYRVAAKTGTSEKKEMECPRCGSTALPAQKVEDIEYYECSICGLRGEKGDFNKSEKYICSTAAFAPADDPQVAIIIMVDEPTKGSLYGSTVAAPYVGNALKNILPYMGVEAVYTPEELAKMAVKVPNCTGYSISYATSIIENSGLKVSVVGNGTSVKKQIPAAGSYIERESGTVVLYTDTSDPTEDIEIPNLIGMTALSANKTLVNRGLNIKIEGTSNYLSGKGAVVVDQSIAAGTKVAKGTVVTVTFRHIDEDDE
ncbi:MAG: penicillin-binding transpeptidase domain-containing protein [Eubacteriales bacterium]